MIQMTDYGNIQLLLSEIRKLHRTVSHFSIKHSENLSNCAVVLPTAFNKLYRLGASDRPNVKIFITYELSCNSASILVSNTHFNIPANEILLTDK